MGTKYEKGTFVIVPNKNALKGMPPNLQIIFFWICSFADENGVCWPSRSTIAENSGIGKQTVDKHIRKLVELGFLIKEKRKDGAMNMTNVYQVMVVGGVVQPMTQHNGYTTLVQPMTQGSTIDSLGGSTIDMPELNLLKTIPNELNQSTQCAFDNFWSAYPIKKGKSVAFSEWEKIEPKLFQTIIEHVKQHSELDDEWLRGYAPHPSTYLHQKRWTDELTPTKGGKKPEFIIGNQGNPERFKDIKKVKEFKL